MDDLGFFTPLGINSFSQMVGNSSSPSDRGAYVMHSGTATPLGTLGCCCPGSFATSVNDNGEVVGWSLLTNCVNQHAFSGETAL